MYATLVFLFWLASMSWLVSTKVLPGWWHEGPPPYAISTDELGPQRLRWRIIWGDRDVGWSETRTTQRIDGTRLVRHEVQFQQLAVLDAARELLGPLAAMLSMGWEEPFPEVDIHMLTEVDLDRSGALQSFETDVGVGDLHEMVRVTGGVDEEELEVRVMTLSESEEAPWREFLRRRIPFPRDARMADAFAPPARFAHLSVGDAWTVPVYRLFPPSDPIQIVHAAVEAEELLEWNGELVSTIVVVYRPDAGQAPTVSQQPLGRVWIRSDGIVIQQEARIARTSIRFVRQVLLDRLDDPAAAVAP